MEFHSFDLEVLGETKRILSLLIDNKLVAIEQRNRAAFCAKYCDQLQKRVNHVVTKKTESSRYHDRGLPI